MSFTLGNQQIAELHLEIPFYGVASAEVVIASPIALSGRQTLVVGNLTLAGTIVDGGVSSGHGRYLWHAGAGGWRTTIPARGYGSTVVKRAGVIRDAAGECGETVSFAIPDVPLGLPGNGGYMRLAGEAWLVFKGSSDAESVPWWVRPDGVTQIGERETGAASTDGSLEVADLEAGRLVIVPAAERVAGYLPGKTIGTNGAQIGTTRIDAKGDEPIRVTLFTRRSTDPSQDIRTLLDRIHTQNAAPERFHGIYEFKVVSKNGEVNGALYGLKPTDATIGLPEIDGRDLRFGIPGFDSILARDNGELVLVSFINGSPNKAVVVGYGRRGADPASPTEVSLDATKIYLGRAVDAVSGKKVGCQDDPVKSGGLTVTPSISPVGSFDIRYGDQDGNTTTWTVSGSNGGGAVVFTVSPLAQSADLNGRIMTPAQGKVYA